MPTLVLLIAAIDDSRSEGSKDLLSFTGHPSRMLLKWPFRDAHLLGTLAPAFTQRSEQRDRA